MKDKRNKYNFREGDYIQYGEKTYMVVGIIIRGGMENGFLEAKETPNSGTYVIRLDKAKPIELTEEFLEESEFVKRFSKDKSEYTSGNARLEHYLPNNIWTFKTELTTKPLSYVSDLQHEMADADIDVLIKQSERENRDLQEWPEKMYL
jgi:hypothetical protein